MGKFTGLNDQEWAIVEPLIPYKLIISRGKTPIIEADKGYDAFDPWNFKILDARVG